MIIVEGFDGGTPTRALAAEIARQAPDLAGAYDRHRADLYVHPAYTEEPDAATADRWYTLHWSHPAVTTSLGTDGSRVWEVTHIRFQDLGNVPAPPRKPLEQRREELPPLTTEGMSEELIRMYGGQKGVLEILTRQREGYLRHDRTVDAYDWAPLAADIIARARKLTAPKLTTPQRAHVAAVRHLRAVQELQAARASVTAQLARADAQGATETGDRLLEYLEALDPGYFTRRTPPPVGTGDGPGRPEVGSPIKVWVGDELAARLELRRRETETRSSAVRRILNAAVAPLSTWELIQVERQAADTLPDSPGGL